MRVPIRWLGTGMALALLIPAAVVQGYEEKLSLDRVPKPVIEAVKARFKDATMMAGSKETEDGRPVYEVTIRHKRQIIDVTLTPEGEILLIEKKIATRDLPRAVARALEDEYPGAAYKIAEEIIKVEKKQEKLDFYEVLLVTVDKRALEVQVTAGGKIVNEEKKGWGRD